MCQHYVSDRHFVSIVTTNTHKPVTLKAGRFHHRQITRQTIDLYMSRDSDQYRAHSNPLTRNKWVIQVWSFGIICRRLLYYCIPICVPHALQSIKKCNIWVSEGTAPRILNLDTRWPQSLHPREKNTDRLPTGQEARWVPQSIQMLWLREKSYSIGNRIPDV
jgi:hypothetical protein